MKSKNEPVERYKLTDAQMAFQKNYAKIRKTEAILSKKLLSQMAGAKQLSDLLRETQRFRMQALQNAPAQPIDDIVGQ